MAWRASWPTPDPGCGGVLWPGPERVRATFGEVHLKVRAALNPSGPAVAFEVFLDALPEPKRRKMGCARPASRCGTTSPA